MEEQFENLNFDPEGNLVFDDQVNDQDESEIILEKLESLVTVRGFKPDLVENLLDNTLRTRSENDPNFNYLSPYRRGTYTQRNTLSPEKLLLGMKIEIGERVEVSFTDWESKRRIDNFDSTCTSVTTWEEREKVSLLFRRRSFVLYAVVWPIPEDFGGSVESFTKIHASKVAFDRIGILRVTNWMKEEETRESEIRNRRTRLFGPNGGLCP
jgi:hypothetical protein